MSTDEKEGRLSNIDVWTKKSLPFWDFSKFFQIFP
jgi:hypothetical protein